MPLLMEFHVTNSCCTSQANHDVRLLKVTCFRSKTAIMKHLSSVQDVPICHVFKTIFDRNYNKGVRDRSRCETCGTFYIYGDIEHIQALPMDKALFEMIGPVILGINLDRWGY